MSQPVVASPKSPAPVQIGTVLTPDDYAQLGARMNRVGFGSDDITAFLSKIEARAGQMARDLVVAATTDLLELVQNVHVDTAMNIYDLIVQRNARGMLPMHNECAQIALNESNAAPRRRRR